MFTSDCELCFQVISLCLLFLGVLLITVPLHMKNLSSYTLSIHHLGMAQNIQEAIISHLSHNLLTYVGKVLLAVSSVLLIPSTLGYVGAVRESRVLLILVILLNNLAAIVIDSCYIISPPS